LQSGGSGNSGVYAGQHYFIPLHKIPFIVSRIFSTLPHPLGDTDHRHDSTKPSSSSTTKDNKSNKNNNSKNKNQQANIIHQQLIDEQALRVDMWWHYLTPR
jgi:hypothetical protein